MYLKRMLYSSALYINLTRVRVRAVTDNIFCVTFFFLECEVSITVIEKVLTTNIIK